MTFSTHTFDCWICGKSCPLEDCKIDERGRAVHQECYVIHVALKEQEPEDLPQLDS